jgi:hypothetical protein
MGTITGLVERLQMWAVIFLLVVAMALTQVVKTEKPKDKPEDYWEEVKFDE